MEGWYQAEVETCAGCKAKDVDAKDRDREPGDRVRVVLDPKYVKRS
jgi:hypothetical protein